LPHAPIGADGQLTERLRKIANDLSSVFQARPKMRFTGAVLGGRQDGALCGGIADLYPRRRNSGGGGNRRGRFGGVESPYGADLESAKGRNACRSAEETRDVLLAALFAEDEARRLEG